MSTLRETQACLIATGESSWRIDFSTGIRSSSAKGTAQRNIAWGCVPLEYSRLGSMIQDCLDHGTLKELMNLPTGWIHRLVPLMQHGPNNLGSFILIPINQRNVPLVFYTSIQLTALTWKRNNRHEVHVSSYLSPFPDKCQYTMCQNQAWNLINTKILQCSRLNYQLSYQVK